MIRDTPVEGSGILLTGASSGIGRELAQVLADRGARLVLTARQRARLDALADEIAARGNPQPAVIGADLSQTWRRRSARGGGDGGARRGRRAREQRRGRRRRIAVGGRRRRRRAGGVRGELLEPARAGEGARAGDARARAGRGRQRDLDGAGQHLAGFGAYAATKAALGLATETLRLELAGSGVHVLEAIPGPVDTAVQGETRLVPGIERMLDRVPLGDAATMARRIADALERGRARVVYPRRAALAYLLPGVARRDTRRLVRRVARETDPAVLEGVLSLVVRTGSSGDAAARQAREAWEHARGRT